MCNVLLVVGEKTRTLFGTCRANHSTQLFLAGMHTRARSKMTDATPSGFGEGVLNLKLDTLEFGNELK